MNLKDATHQKPNWAELSAQRENGRLKLHITSGEFSGQRYQGIGGSRLRASVIPEDESVPEEASGPGSTSGLEWESGPGWAWDQKWALAWDLE